MTITYTMFNGELGGILVENKELRLDFSKQGFVSDAHQIVVVAETRGHHDLLFSAAA